jgi:hypothetical protein
MDMEFYREWLQWVIDFVQMDISKLSLKEKHGFYQKFNWLAGPYLFNTSFDPFGKSIEFSQNQINEYQSTALDIQKELKQFLSVITGTRANYGLPDLTAWIRPEGLWPPLPKNHRIYFQMNSIPKDMTPKNWAVLNLSRLIQGLEMHVIGKCEECGSYFLNFSLRKKTYCSPRCASRSLARTRKKRWGTKKYGTYLKVQRQRANETYQEKRAAIGKTIRHRPKKRGSKRIPKMM